VAGHITPDGGHVRMRWQIGRTGGRADGQDSLGGAILERYGWELLHIIPMCLLVCGVSYRTIGCDRACVSRVAVVLGLAGATKR